MSRTSAAVSTRIFHIFSSVVCYARFLCCCIFLFPCISLAVIIMHCGPGLFIDLFIM